MIDTELVDRKLLLIDPEKLFESVRQAASGILEYTRQIQDWLARRYQRPCYQMVRRRG